MCLKGTLAGISTTRPLNLTLLFKGEIVAIYQLSDYGRAVTWKTWKSLNACGLPNCTQAYKELGPQSSWTDDITLGDIEDACQFTGRSLARYAVEIQKMECFAIPYKSPFEKENN